MNKARHPSVSFIIEWENARRDEAVRAFRMLDTLGRQIVAARLDDFEILVLLEDDVRQALGQHILDALPEPVAERVRMLESPGLRYYEQKNFGVSRACGDIVVFIDSDVIPEADWLARILHALDDETVQVVGGATYMDPDDFFSRALQLIWIFPQRNPRSDMISTTSFFANNVAFRRSLIATNPFPDSPRYRGQCGMLARSLRAQGVTIWRDMGARVSHGPFIGYRHLLWRGLYDGNDEIIEDRRKHKGAGSMIVRSLRRYGQQLRRLEGRVISQHRMVGMGAAGAIWCGVMAFGFCTARLFGSLIVIAFPGAPRHYAKI
jgi:hypothetical protein